MILSCGRGMHEEGYSDVDEFEDEMTEAMEQAIFNFIAEILMSWLILTKRLKIFAQQMEEGNHQLQLHDNLVKDQRR